MLMPHRTRHSRAGGNPVVEAQSCRETSAI